MVQDWCRSEVLKAVFPLLGGDDLGTCLLVCRQWRDTASDDYFWRCICVKRWPSICKRPPPTLSYRKLFITFSRPHRPQPLLPPRLSFNDLEFYIDLWSDQGLIFSEAVSGPVLQTGIKKPPPEISDVLRAHLDGPDYKMTMQVEPKFTIPLGQGISVSILVVRKDTNEIACILNQSPFDYIDGSAFRAMAYDYLNFSADHPFVSGIRAWVSLLFVAHSDNNIINVFGIEIDFCNAASSESEVLWLLDMLDWKSGRL